jgi:hypothetical protein
MDPHIFSILRLAMLLLLERRIMIIGIAGLKCPDAIKL